MPCSPFLRYDKLGELLRQYSDNKLKKLKMIKLEISDVTIWYYLLKN